MSGVARRRAFPVAESNESCLQKQLRQFKYLLQRFRKIFMDKSLFYVFFSAKKSDRNLFFKFPCLWLTKIFHVIIYNMNEDFFLSPRVAYFSEFDSQVKPSAFL